MARVREACLEAALEAWEHGGMSGLCAEGRLELATGALRAADVDAELDGRCVLFCRGDRLYVSWLDAATGQVASHVVG